MKSHIIFAVILVFQSLLGISTVEGGTMTVYEHAEFLGESRRLLNFKNCLDLINGWEDRISSINTGGRCVLLCEHKRCQGKCEKIEPGTMRHNSLASLNFNDVASSYRLC